MDTAGGSRNKLPCYMVEQERVEVFGGGDSACTGGASG